MENRFKEIGCHTNTTENRGSHRFSNTWLAKRSKNFSLESINYSKEMVEVLVLDPCRKYVV